MFNRTTKLRWRRRVRRSRQHVEDIGLQTEESLERHFFRRLTRLLGVRRFIGGWLLLMLLLVTGVIMQTRALGGYYQVLKPAPGGTYTEGIIGTFTNANPIYASGGVDGAVSRLLFSGLMKYNDQNELVGDLAESYSVNEAGTRYEVTLKPDLKWHDSQPLTAADVIFTYQAIQNPDAKSALFSSWSGIQLEQINDLTLAFTLPNTLSSFPYALTNGIVPKHLLESFPASQLRSTRFNTMQPVGSGPFRWQAIEVTGLTPESRQERIGLVRNENYHGGTPNLDSFTIVSFRGEEQLLKSFENQEITAAVGLGSVPDNLSDNTAIREHNIPLTGEVLVFFKTSHPILADVKVRQALVKAADPGVIVDGLDHSVIAARSPLLASHIGFDKTLLQFPTNVAEANALLDSAGWVMGADGVRAKGEERLTFILSAVANSEYNYVTRTLQQQWRAVGVDVSVDQPEDSKLPATVSRHDYDALLYGISLGTDPDVFAYWHSSQADPRAPTRLNLSEYKSSVADRALEAGRTRADAAVRATKYRPFLEAWRNDAPALALYQPRFLYVTHGEVYGFKPLELNNAIERFNSVEQWMIREVKAIK